MIDKEFRNAASPEERRREWLEDQRRLKAAPEPTSYSAIQRGEIEFASGGRFSAAKPEAGSKYPHVSGPWSSDPVGPEPSLGYSIDQAPVTGEAHEVARSIGIAARVSPGGAEMVTAARSTAHADFTSSGSPPSGVSPTASEPLPLDPPVALSPEASEVLGRALRRR